VSKALEAFQPLRELGNSNNILLLAAYVSEQRCNANKVPSDFILVWYVYY